MKKTVQFKRKCFSSFEENLLIKETGNGKNWENAGTFHELCLKCSVILEG